MEILNPRLLRYSPIPFSILALCIFLDCCQAFRPQQAQAQLQPGQSDCGYALLFDLVGDEKDVSKLRFIKHERPELKSLLQEIAKANRDAYVTLEKFAKQNPQFNIKDKGLPPAEVEARNAISKFKENSILHSK